MSGLTPSGPLERRRLSYKWFNSHAHTYTNSWTKPSYFTEGTMLQTLWAGCLSRAPSGTRLVGGMRPTAVPPESCWCNKIFPHLCKQLQAERTEQASKQEHGGSAFGAQDTIALFAQLAGAPSD
eukprot:366456-Chlamydomonas_euryale.AAC.17